MLSRMRNPREDMRKPRVRVETIDSIVTCSSNHGPCGPARSELAKQLKPRWLALFDSPDGPNGTDYHGRKKMQKTLAFCPAPWRVGYGWVMLRYVGWILRQRGRTELPTKCWSSCLRAWSAKNWSRDVCEEELMEHLPPGDCSVCSIGQICHCSPQATSPAQQAVVSCSQL
jgi:hypothetical protein